MESAEGPDLRQYMQTFFASFLPDDHPPIKIDRAHRGGRMLARDTRGPRVVLIKLHDFPVKERLLQEARK